MRATEEDGADDPKERSSMTPFSDTFTQGGQTQLHHLRMMAQVMGTTMKASAWIGGIAFVGLVYAHHVWQDLWFLLSYGKAWLRVECLTFLPSEFWDHSWMMNRDGSFYEVGDRWMMHQETLAVMAMTMLLSLIKILCQSFLVALTSGLIMARFWMSRGKKRQETTLLSGTSLVTPRQIIRILDRQNLRGTLSLGSVPLVKDAEVEHMLMVGTTGCGKTNAMIELLQQIRTQKGKAVIVDTTGSFVDRFYDPEHDIILNPLDDRSASWSLWKECQETYLIDNFVSCMIPLGGHDPFWSTSARTVLSVAMTKLVSEGSPTMADLLHGVLHGSLKEVAPFFRHTAASALMDPDGEKTALSIRATLAASLRCLERIPDAIEPAFAIRDWIRDATRKGFLFLSTSPEQRSTVIPLITAWLSLATQALMGQRSPEKVWFVIDELASLQKLPDLSQALAELRKYQGCCVLGLQTLSQLDVLYGHDTSRIICGLTGTKVIFRIPDTVTAKRMSEFLGEQERIEPQESISYGAHDMRDGVNLSDHKHTQPLVPYTDIMTLPNLTAYLQLPRALPITKITFTYHG